jgi:hypothetical protein
MRSAVEVGVYLLATVGLVGLAMQARVSATGVEICDNGVDDTRGLIDCADPACADDPACDFEEGCCVLFNCEQDSTAGGFNGAELTCLDNVAQEPCARHVQVPDPCFENSQLPQCLTGGLICEEANLLKGSCARVPGCEQFAGSHSAPAASNTGLVALALLLAGTGFYYVRSRS